MDSEIKFVIKNKAKDLFNQKDYEYICTFLDCYKYHSVIELIESELKSEYKKCIPESMTDRYCLLLDFKAEVSKYDVDEWQLENYYLEKQNESFEDYF